MVFLGGTLPACALVKPMKRELFWHAFALILTGTFALVAQVTLSPSPARSLGQPRLTLSTVNPNLVEGRELYQPGSVVVDTNANPWVLYVADTANHRVLVWVDATSVANDRQADFVIGQKDLYTTFPQGPVAISQNSYGAQLYGGLYYPTGLAVDSYGNLFVADTGNNRILRFRRPYAAARDQVLLPDLVIGQADTTTGNPNRGGPPSAKTLSLFVNTSLASGLLQFRTTLLIDTAGNLWCTDTGNQRVLRFPAVSIGPDATGDPEADLVLGQLDFNISPAVSPSAPVNAADSLRSLYKPLGLAIDSKGRVFASDTGHRVLVYEPPLQKGKYASRWLGDGSQPSGSPKATSLLSPGGIFLVDDAPYVVDTWNSRILRFEPYDSWGTTLPQATDLIGQNDYTVGTINRGGVQPAADKVTLALPAQATVAGQNLYVADTMNHRILVLPKPAPGSGATMAPSRVVGQHGLDTNGPNLLDGRGLYLGTDTGNANAGVVMDYHSDPPHLYVADSLNNRVLGYRDARKVHPGDRADLIIGQFNQGTNAPDEYRWLVNCPTGNAKTPSRQSLYQPTGLAVDAEGNLYVADTGNGRVLRFPRPFDQPLTQAAAADLVLGQKDFTTARGVPDPTRQDMFAPYGLAFTVEGHLFVSDVYHNRVLLFQKPFRNYQPADTVLGQPDFSSNSPGSTATLLNSPRHISTDSSDRLYVADMNNNRVQVFEDAVHAQNGVAAVTLRQPPRGLQKPVTVIVNSLPGAEGEIWVGGQEATWPYLYRIWRLPEYIRYSFSGGGDVLPLNPAEPPLALALDGAGNPIVAYATNRIAFYFRGFRAVNSANYLPRLAPAAISTLWPLDRNSTTGACSQKFTTETVVFDQLPYPPVATTIADLQVLVNGTPAPIHFVSPCQINFWIPNDPALSSGKVQIEVVRKSSGQVIAVGCDAAMVSQNPEIWSCQSGSLSTDVAAPALFTADTTGVGQVRARNEDWTINSPSNPIARGKTLRLYGTGAGFIPGAPPDGMPAESAEWTPQKPLVYIGGSLVPDANVTYSGLTPTLVEVWQIDVKIPESVAPGNEVNILIYYNGRFSKDASSEMGRTTIAVK